MKKWYVVCALSLLVVSTGEMCARWRALWPAARKWLDKGTDRIIMNPYTPYFVGFGGGYTVKWELDEIKKWQEYSREMEESLDSMKKVRENLDRTKKLLDEEARLIEEQSREYKKEFGMGE